MKANRFRINLKQNSLLFGPNFLGQIAIHLYPFEGMSLSLSVSTFETLPITKIQYIDDLSVSIPSPNGSR